MLCDSPGGSLIALEGFDSITFFTALMERSVLQSVHKIKKNSSNGEYEALSFVSDGKTYQSRLAKKTPKKDGYFLAVWKKDSDGPNAPYDVAEFSDYLLVFIADGFKRGYFCFPRSELAQRGVLRADGRGKMAFRVYPIWCVDLNASAARAQRWQVQYFHELGAKTQQCTCGNETNRNK